MNTKLAVDSVATNAELSVVTVALNNTYIYVIQ